MSKAPRNQGRTGDQGKGDGQQAIAQDTGKGGQKTTTDQGGKTANKGGKNGGCRDVGANVGKRGDRKTGKSQPAAKDATVARDAKATDANAVKAVSCVGKGKRTTSGQLASNSGQTGAKTGDTKQGRPRVGFGPVPSDLLSGGKTGGEKKHFGQRTGADQFANTGGKRGDTKNATPQKGNGQSDPIRSVAAKNQDTKQSGKGKSSGGATAQATKTSGTPVQVAQQTSKASTSTGAGAQTKMGGTHHHAAQQTAKVGSSGGQSNKGGFASGVNHVSHQSHSTGKKR